MGHKNGCYNRAPLRTSVTVQDGWISSGPSRVPVMQTIANPMTKGCQYTKSVLGQQDKGCEGCSWREGHASRG